jgi:hypothetical protein
VRTNDPNLPQLRRIAEALGDLREQLVFVGGSVAGLMLTDPLAEGVRPFIVWRKSLPDVALRAMSAVM